MRIDDLMWKYWTWRHSIGMNVFPAVPQYVLPEFTAHGQAVFIGRVDGRQKGIERSFSDLWEALIRLEQDLPGTLEMVLTRFFLMVFIILTYWS